MDDLNGNRLQIAGVLAVVDVSLTCFQAAPVNLFEEWMTLENVAVVVAEAETLGWILLHQTLTDVLALFGELWSVGNCIVEDPAGYLSVLNLDKNQQQQCFPRMEVQGSEMFLVPSLLAL